MTKEELIEWYHSIYPNKMPRYVEVLDANYSQIFIDGKWQNAVYIWSIFKSGTQWKYVETDSERGYVSDLKAFENESQATQYAKEILTCLQVIANDDSKEDMLCRYIMQKYGYSEKRAKAMVSQMAPYHDIFEEFFNYARVGEFQKEDRTQTVVCGYTAERLVSEYNLSPLGAYNYLVYLKEEPQRALQDLKDDLPRK